MADPHSRKTAKVVLPREGLPRWELPDSVDPADGNWISHDGRMGVIRDKPVSAHQYKYKVQLQQYTREQVFEVIDWLENNTIGHYRFRIGAGIVSFSEGADLTMFKLKFNCK